MILTLPGIVDAVGGKVPVLTDGRSVAAMTSSRRSRWAPVCWDGLYVARPLQAGVQSVVEMAQTELGRYMGMCGKPTLKALDRTA